MLAVNDAELAELVGGDLADAVQLAYRQTTDELFDLIRGDHEQTVGFFPVAGDLRQKLVWRNACGNGDVQLVGDPAANVLGDARGAAAEMRAVRHIQVGLVQRKRLDQVGVVGKDRMNFFRSFAISLHTRLDDGQVRAQL